MTSRPTDLLPPNATPLERSYAQSGGARLALDVPIDAMWDPWRCPAPQLPWLAWALSVDEWSDAWPETVKRRVIAASPQVHRRKGTRAAIEEALRAIGVIVRLKEWHELSPPLRRGTFKATALINDVYASGVALTPERAEQIRRSIYATKPKSRGAAIDIGLALTSRVGAAAFGRGLSLSPARAEARPPPARPFVGAAGVVARAQGLALAAAEASATYDIPPRRAAFGAKLWGAAAALVGLRVEAAPGAQCASRIAAACVVAAPLALAQCRMEAQP